MTDTTTLPPGLNLTQAPPPPPQPGGDYAPPAGVPVSEPSLGQPQPQVQPDQAQPQAPQSQPQQPERPRDPNTGKWMSQTQWERDVMGVTPEGVPTETLAPIPAPVAQPVQAEQPAPTATPDLTEQQRRLQEQEAALAQRQAEFEEQQRQLRLRAEVGQFESQWAQAERDTLAQADQLPVDQARAAMQRFYNARQQATLQFQNAKLAEQAQVQQSRYQQIEQQHYASQVRQHVPGFAQQQATQILGEALTDAELSEIVSVFDSMGPDAIQSHIQHSIRPRREMQRQLDQLQRSNTVQQLTNAGVFAVSGGTGQPPGVPGPPKEGYGSLDQAAASWYR